MRVVRIAILLLFTPGVLTPASAQESAASVVAAHIRNQGYVCQAPVSATHESRSSRPDEQVWLLTCGNARYRVRLVPDMAAAVEQIR
jgi:hypothetical protein